MDRQKKVAVIIAAAGSGSRVGGDLPKQYLDLGGKPILVRTVEAFQQHRGVHEIYVVASAMHRELCRTQLMEKRSLPKVKAVLTGGQTRQESVYAALTALPADVDYILVHDAARPFVEEGLISAVLDALFLRGSAAAAIPVKDTIKVAQEGVFSQTLDRTSLYAVQTPQGFPANLLKEAHRRAREEGFCGTDDAVLVEHLGEKVYLVEGDDHNLKLTTREDLVVGEAILRMAKEEKPFFAEQKCSAAETFPSTEEQLPAEEKCLRAEDSGWRVGTGYDVHRLTEGRKLILGGVEIPFVCGLLGHSDADVLTHALMDALLGAGGLGDIGRHFPDHDEQYKGISSLQLLAQVETMLAACGWTVENIDGMVMAEKPKIAPYIDEMRKHIAHHLLMDIERINVKGTTTEGLGFCGRGEGIAAQVTVLIRRRK